MPCRPSPKDSAFHRGRSFTTSGGDLSKGLIWNYSRWVINKKRLVDSHHIEKKAVWICEMMWHKQRQLSDFQTTLTHIVTAIHKQSTLISFPTFSQISYSTRFTDTEDCNFSTLTCSKYNVKKTRKHWKAYWAKITLPVMEVSHKS